MALAPAGAADAFAGKSVYFGASGVLWAMWYLQQAGVVSLRIEPRDLIDRVLEAYLDKPDTGDVVPSYLLGEVGILLVQWRLTGSRATADRLHDAIARNIPNPTNESLWAAPGTMVGALHMLRWTDDTRWRDLYLDNVEQLWRTWLPSEHAPCHVWTQDLYGNSCSSWAPATASPAMRTRCSAGRRCCRLARARSFAMHAIAQGERAKVHYGARATRCGRATPGSPCTYGTACRHPAACRPSTCWTSEARAMPIALLRNVPAIRLTYHRIDRPSERLP